MPIKNAEEYWQIMQKFDPGKGKLTAFPDLADPANYPLTDEEKAQVSQGKYVPATDKHPAFNYPVPEVPAALAKGGRAEDMGADFLKYWIEAYNYLIATGQTDELDPITEMPNKTMTGSVISDTTKIYAAGVWFEKCTYEADIAAGTKVVTLENQVHIYIPVDFKNSECRAHGGQSVSKDNTGSIPQVVLIRYFSDTKKYVMFGFVEATGTYYDLPLAGKALVCSHTPTNCPQDAYDELRSQLKSSAAAKDGETTS